MSMELVTQAAGICLVGALLGLTLKRGTPELSLLLTAAAAAVILLALMEPMGQLLAFIRQLAGKTGVPEELFLPLYKTVGIALVVKIGGGLCRDAGESALCSLLELAGTVCALLTALPLLQAVLDLLLELI